jgi:hypothetical protein
VVCIAAVATVGCSGGDDGPGTATVSPTAEGMDATGFLAALKTLDAQLKTDGMEPEISRLKEVRYTCLPEDVTGKPGGADCDAAGEQIQGVLTSAWHAEGGLVKTETVVSALRGYATGFQPESTDTFGTGAFRVYAFDGIRHTAVLTVISRCLPETQCSGSQRLAFVAPLQFVNGRWLIASLMTVFVDADDFLAPSAEARALLPAWERLE